MSGKRVRYYSASVGKLGQTIYGVAGADFCEIGAMRGEDAFDHLDTQPSVPGRRGFMRDIAPEGRYVCRI
jgi:hypothetical protein